MATIIKSRTARTAEPVIYRFEDEAAEARQLIDEATAEAATIVAEALSQADEIRCQAEQDGRAAAEAAAMREMQSRLESLLPAMASMTQQIGDSREAWLQQWQQRATALVVKIAEKIVRKELARQPSITLVYVREALEMCAAAPQVRVLLHPDDAQSLGESAKLIVREIAPAAHAEIVADESVAHGGCRIETRHGEIDQQIETQLRRIETELTGEQ